MDKPIIWEGRAFAKILHFDCHVVELETEYGGGYFTVIPISPAEFRKHTPTKAGVTIQEADDYTTFNVRCDWGEVFQMMIPNENVTAIEAAREGVIKHELIWT